MSECRICHGTGRAHQGRCPKFIGSAGPCSCANTAPCFLCRADRLDAWRAVGYLIVVLAVLALAALAFLVR